MAVEQSIVMGIALVALFIRALTESERAEQRRERYELAGGSSGPRRRAGAPSAPPRRLSRIPPCPAIAPIRIASSAMLGPGEHDALAQLRAVADRSRRRRARAAPSAARRRRCARRARSTPARRPRRPRAAATSPATVTPGRSSSPSTCRCSSPRERVERPLAQLRQRAHVVPVLVHLVDVERHVVLEQHREDVLGPVHERALGEVVEDLGLEHVDPAVAEVRQRLLGRGLLLKARDRARRGRAARRRTRACRHLLDRQRGDAAASRWRATSASGRCRSARRRRSPRTARRRRTRRTPARRPRSRAAPPRSGRSGARRSARGSTPGSSAGWRSPRRSRGARAGRRCAPSPAGRAPAPSAW